MAIQDAYVERVVDLLDPGMNRLNNMGMDEARDRVLSGDAARVGEIDGSFAILARDGKTVRMARSLDRPMRYFLAKRQEGPALIVADRIDAIHEQLRREGLEGQFHPSYTRMVPAHYVVEIQLVGCPDPDPVYTRYFTPERNTLPADLDEIGRRYAGALADEVGKWLRHHDDREPIGVEFSGGHRFRGGVPRRVPCDAVAGQEPGTDEGVHAGLWGRTGCGAGAGIPGVSWAGDVP